MVFAPVVKNTFISRHVSFNQLCCVYLPLPSHHTAECAYGKRCGGRVIASPSNIWAPKISTIHISMAFEGT